jgi:hypothetical protein
MKRERIPVAVNWSNLTLQTSYINHWLFPSLSIAASVNSSVIKARKKRYYFEKQSIVTEMALTLLSF